MSDLPPGWEWATLGEIAETSLGKMLDKGRSTNQNLVPYLRNVNVQWGRFDLSSLFTIDIPLHQRSAYEVKAGDLLVCEGGEIGRCAIWPGSTTYIAYQKALHRVRPSGGVVTRYLRYLLEHLSISNELLPYSSGSTIKHLPQQQLRCLRLPLPPTAEQRRIVTALEDHLSRLEAATRVTDSIPSARLKLEQSIFEAAVTGRLSDRRADDTPVDISLESARHRLAYRPPAGTRRARELPPRAREMLARETLPDSWRWVEWSQIGYSNNGITFPSADYIDRGIRLIRPGNLSGDGKVTWHPEATRHLPEAYIKERSDLVVPGRALIMNLTAQSLKDQFLGRTCLKMEDGPALLNQRLAWLKPVTGELDYLLLVFRSPIFRRLVDELHTGSLIQHIHTWQVDKFMVPLPPTEEQRRIAVSVDELLTKIARGMSLITSTSRRAQSLHRSLLAEAFAGRLVPQDPGDEPASVLLERIRAERAARPKPKRTRRTRRQPNTTQETLL